MAAEAIRLADQGEPVSAGSDSAVERADTEQHEVNSDSLSAAAGAREVMGQQVQVQEVPSDWVPSSDDVAWARARLPALDVLRFTENFILSCRAKGYRYANISAAWRRWLTDPKGKLPLLPANNTAQAAPFSEDRRHDRSHASQQPRPASPVEKRADIIAGNAAAEGRVLERILARGAGHHAAGHPG
jgi:hypothetical protein